MKGQPPFISSITRMPEERRELLIAKADTYLTSIGACAGIRQVLPEDKKSKARQ